MAKNDKDESKLIDPKHLVGLKFNFSAPKTVVKDGEKKIEYEVRERNLRPDDILDWKDYGDRVVFVTADGRKITVAKNAKETEGK